MTRPTIGDRVAFTVQFLRDTGQRTGPTGAKRGTLMALPPSGNFPARVRWDDWSDAKRAYLSGQLGEDYAEEATRLGEPANLANLTRVGRNAEFCAC